MVVGLLQVRRGLASFNELRTNLTGVREGRDARLGGEYPSEVQPLVSDLNALLSDREQRVTRALTKAGDLAHGLKTPLTLLNQQAERAKAEGQTALAAAIMQQVERMRRQIDYHLAHARASASGGNPDGALPRADVGRCAGAHDDDDSRRSPPRHRRARVARALRPQPARGFRGDARQPRRQRLQVGEDARRGAIGRSMTDRSS